METPAEIMNRPFFRYADGFGRFSLCDQGVCPFKDRTFCDEFTSSVSSEFVAIFSVLFGFGIQQW